MRALLIGQYLGLLAVYFLLGIAKQPQQVVGDYNDLLMHFIGYVVAGVSASIAFLRQPVWLRALQLFCFSTLVEIVQYNLPWRSFEVRDILANLMGIVAGLGLWWIMLKFYKRLTGDS